MLFWWSLRQFPTWKSRWVQRRRLFRAALLSADKLEVQQYNSKIEEDWGENPNTNCKNCVRWLKISKVPKTRRTPINCEATLPNERHAFILIFICNINIVRYKIFSTSLRPATASIHSKGKEKSCWQFSNGKVGVNKSCASKFVYYRQFQLIRLTGDYSHLLQDTHKVCSILSK